MSRLTDKFEPMDIIAIIIILCCLVALKIKPDTTFRDVLLIISGVYFGKNIKKQNGGNS